MKQLLPNAVILVCYALAMSVSDDRLRKIRGGHQAVTTKIVRDVDEILDARSRTTQPVGCETAATQWKAKGT